MTKFRIFTFDSWNLFEIWKLLFGIYQSYDKIGLMEFIQNNIWLFVALIIWILAWKGYALWVSARRSHKWWFVAIFILNTFALLEIIYLFTVAKVQKPRRPEGSGSRLPQSGTSGKEETETIEER